MPQLASELLPDRVTHTVTVLNDCVVKSSRVKSHRVEALRCVTKVARTNQVWMETLPMISLNKQHENVVLPRVEVSQFRVTSSPYLQVGVE